MLQRIVDEFDRVCRRRKLKVSAGKCKVMVFERVREQAIDFAKPYRVGLEAIFGCKIWLGKEKMEEVNEFKYLGTILCKHGSMEGEIRERTVKGRQVMGALERVMNGRNVSMAVKKGIRNGEWSSLWCMVCVQLIMLLAESESMLLRIVDEFDRVCRRRKLKVNFYLFFFFFIYSNKERLKGITKWGKKRPASHCSRKKKQVKEWYKTYTISEGEVSC